MQPIPIQIPRLFAASTRPLQVRLHASPACVTAPGHAAATRPAASMMQLWTAPVQSYPPLYVYLAPPLLQFHRMQVRAPLIEDH